jgi:hypothetical protein
MNDGQTEAREAEAALARSIPPWVRTVVRMMDDVLSVPGTKLGVGWDAIVGLFVPFVGDTVSALSHIALLWTAFRIRVPRIVVARMVINAVIDIVTGAVPVLGDLFDVAFKANRKNLELLERAQLEGPRAARASDYLVVVGAMLSLLVAMLVPLFLAGWLIAEVSRRLRS